MRFGTVARGLTTLTLALALSGCGGWRPFSGSAESRANSAERAATELSAGERREGPNSPSGTIWDLLRRGDAAATVSVNRYIWNGALEVLDFLPIENIDPFSGVITTGFGTPPGGGRPYRATVHVTDAALDARSLNVAILTQSGPASADTVRAVENAILNRARQLRIRDRGL